jgi:hypothetical protein
MLSTSAPKLAARGATRRDTEKGILFEARIFLDGTVTIGVGRCQIFRGATEFFGNVTTSFIVER